MSDVFSGVKGKLGFGLMRLPKLKDDTIDVAQTADMVDLFLEAGFTYFDTAFVYAGSEEAIRKALVERYPRDSFQLASKCAAWVSTEGREGAISQFETSLERSGAKYFDYYLLHNLGENRSQCFDDYGMWDWIADLKKSGKIRHMGLSCHATPEQLEEILSAHREMEFVQLQINYADWDNPAIESGKCYDIARKYDIPIIVMEPVKGGNLVNVPAHIKDIFTKANPTASPANWAIRFAASLPGVGVVLSGMSDIQQMKDNISFMKDFIPLSESENKVLKQVKTELDKIPTIPCTVCDYCAKVCPKNIGISGSFTAYNMFKTYDNLAFAKNNEAWLVPGHQKARANECIKCGLCEDACPQNIKIRDELENVAKAFDM